MGYSGATCGQNYVNWSKTETGLHFQCQGTTRIREVLELGLNDLNQEGDDGRLDEFNRCYYAPEANATETYPAMRSFQSDLVEQSVMYQCNGL